MTRPLSHKQRRRSNARTASAKSQPKQEPADIDWDAAQQRLKAMLDNIDHIREPLMSSLAVQKLRPGIPRPKVARNTGSGKRAEPQTPLGARLRQLRQDTELTVAKFGAHVGYAPSRITDWEIGVNTPTLPTLKKIADALNITVAQILEGVM